MQLTEADKEQLRTILRELVVRNEKWLHDQRILVGDKGDYWVLDYVRGLPNEYNWLTRGMVIEKPSDGWTEDVLKLIRSFPFTRFYNHQDTKHAAPMDFTRADMLEKLDGVLVGVFFPRGSTEPRWHTRKMMSACEADLKTVTTGQSGKKYEMMRLIGKYVHQLCFDRRDASMSHTFEFVHDSTFVWTKYRPEQYGLYLVGSRVLDDQSELTEEQLDEAAARLGAKRPRRFNAVDDFLMINNLMTQLAEETPDFEGFVFRDKMTGARVKVKRADYVRYHHNLGTLSYRSLLPKVLENDIDDILACLPEARERIELIQRKYDQYLTEVTTKVERWREAKLDRRTLALRLFGKDGEADRFAASQIMSLFEEQNDGVVHSTIDQTLRRMAFTGTERDRSSRPLLKLLGLRDA